MRHHQKTVVLRQTNDDVPILFLRVVGVGDSDAERITEDRRSLAKRDFVPTDILCFFFRVPLKFHVSSVATLSPFANPVIAF